MPVVKLTKLASSQRELHAALPYGLAVSVARGSSGRQLPQVVVEMDGRRVESWAYGSAYFVVVVGLAIGVAIRRVVVCVKEKLLWV